MKLARLTRDLLAEFAARRPLRAGSLIVTVYGDAIAPRGGSVWIGSLIRTLEPFGLNARLVRTSVSRLAQDGWFTAATVGRRSFYGLTEEGSRRCEQASRRIYHTPSRHWDGVWTFLVLRELDAADREQVRRELRWLGFAALASNLMAHPTADSASLRAQLEELGLRHAVVLFRAECPEVDQGDALAALVHRAWALTSLEQRYLGFLARFRPVYAIARRLAQIPPETAYALRILLIHEYRRILLRDPGLPRQLLPPRWPGEAAFRLTRNLYVRLLPAAECYLSETMETATGSLPQAGPALARRFADDRVASTGSAATHT